MFYASVPSLHPKTVKCLCYVLQRPQFKSFTLSSASVVDATIEDLLCAIASRRLVNSCAVCKDIIKRLSLK